MAGSARLGRKPAEPDHVSLARVESADPPARCAGPSGPPRRGLPAKQRGGTRLAARARTRTGPRPAASSPRDRSPALRAPQVRGERARAV